MYRIIIYILFLFDPETAHRMAMLGFRVLLYIPGMKYILKRRCRRYNAVLKKEIAGLTFLNPVGLAAGFDKNGEYLDILAYLGFGFIEVGTVTPKPQFGNPKPRLFRLKKDQNRPSV